MMSEPPANEKQQLKTLISQVNLLNQRLRKRTSFKYLFSYAVVQGIGYAIGATIIASIVFAFLARAVMTVDYVPLLNQVLNSEQVRETLIEQSQPQE